MATKQTASKPAASAKSAAAELSGATAVAVIGAVNTAMVLPAGIKVKRAVTLPSLVLKVPGQEAMIQFLSPYRVSTVVDKKDTKREPAIIANVRDIQTGKEFIFLIPSVVKANLERDYPSDGYVNCAFYIRHVGKRTESQRYSDFEIYEVEPDGSAE